MALHSEFTASTQWIMGSTLNTAVTDLHWCCELTEREKTEYGEWQRSEHSITECGSSVDGMKHASGNGSEMI